MTTFTATEKFKEIERELLMRRRVYPRFVEQKKMSQTQADRQIALMDAIADDYCAQVGGERLI